MRSLSADSTPADVAERQLRECLAEALERHAGSLVLLCSFQKEESVLVDELVQLAADRSDGTQLSDLIRIVTIDTGVLFPETLETWRQFEESFGIKVQMQDAAAQPPGEAWSGPEHCCSVAKVAALERALEGAQAWVTGVRRQQGPTRAGTQLIESDPARGILKYNPLASWGERDLWRRIYARRLPYNPLHDRGYASIGCAPCTQPGEGRAGRWAGSDKTECGLHLDPAQVLGEQAQA